VPILSSDEGERELMPSTFAFNDVTGVLLADGWHEVADQSFSTARTCTESLHDGTSVVSFLEVDADGNQTGIYCPLSQALAVRHTWQ
jgi:hypothetical protein